MSTLQKNPKTRRVHRKFINKLAGSSSEETRKALRNYFEKLLVYFIALTQELPKAVREGRDED